MGSSIPISFSCADCSSRVMTVEDLESSYNSRSKDIYYLEDRTDINDEVTVFESPIKTRANRLYKSTEALARHSRPKFCRSPEKRLVSYSGESTRVKLLNSHKNTEEVVSSELSSPNIAPLCKRQRTFSSNFSSISVNLVDSIRKNSIGSYSKTDHSPRNELI